MKTRNTKHTERRKNRKIAAVVASLFGIETQAADAGQWTSDPDTHDSWFSGEDGVSTGDNANDSTRNTGRIWTDKSVYTENVTLSSQSGEEAFTIENCTGRSFSTFLCGKHLRTDHHQSAARHRSCARRLGFDG